MPSKAKSGRQRKPGSVERQERAARESTRIGAVLGPFYELVNYGIWVGPPSVTVSDSPALAQVQRYARQAIAQLRRHGPNADLQAIFPPLPITGERDEALLVAFDARWHVSQIAEHLREANRWERLRICETCEAAYFYAWHARTKNCRECSRAARRSR